MAVSEAKLIMCRKFILNCSAINLNILNQCKIPKEFTRTLVLFLQRSDERVEMKHLLLFQRGSNDAVELNGRRED